MFALDAALISVCLADDSCPAFILDYLDDDLHPPPQSLEFLVKTASGKIVKLTIPNNDTDAVVTVDGEII